MMPLVDGAVFSPCGRYRHSLTRDLRSAPTLLAPQIDRKPRVLAVGMLNPSTAGVVENDRTTNRNIGFATRWGFDWLVQWNLFDWIETHPRELATVAAPSSPDNDRHILELATGAELVIAAWGVHPLAPPRAAVVQRLLTAADVELYCLGLTESGAPKHPLARGVHWIPNDVTPTRWTLP